MHNYGYGKQSSSGSIEPVQFDREPLRAGEVAIDITHCGVCHSDLHQVNNDWGNTVWPCVPGHEIVGIVTQVGDGVSKFKVGDRVGVGCMVNSCQQCEYCKRGDEQYCQGPRSCTLTYNGPKKPDGTNTYGGYSTGIIVREAFVLKIPDAIDSQHAAPILCAGITTYQPMKHFGLKAGHRIGVAGIGGLGHMAVQLAKALGAEVIALTTTPEKADLVKRLGASEVVNMKDKAAVETAKKSLDFLLDTIPYEHDLQPYIGLMKTDGHIVVVGNFIKFPAFVPGDLVFERISVSGSLIGGVADTQEVLELCAKHDIRPEVQLIDPKDVEWTYKQLKGEDVRFRHVMDMSLLKARVQNKVDGIEDAAKLATPTRGEPN